MVERYVLKKLRETPLEEYVQTPYYKQSGVTADEASALLASLINDNPPDLETVVKPLLLASYSAELQGMSMGFSQSDSPTMSDAEAVDRALQGIDELLKREDPKANIANRDRYPDVDWLDEEDFAPIGDVGGVTLIMIGTEQGTDAPIVSKFYTDDPLSEELYAMPLYNLLSNSQDPVNITADI